MFDITFSTSVKYKGDYYLAAHNVSGLFKFSEDNNKLEYLFPFSNGKQFNYQYNLSFLYKNKAWFIPYFADSIAVVDLEELSVDYIELKYNCSFKKTYVKFISYCIYEDHYALLTPQDVDIAVIIDLETSTIRVIDGVATEDQNFSGSTYRDGKIMLYPWDGDTLVEIDSSSNEIKKFKWGDNGYLYGNCVFDNNSNSIIHVPYMARDILIEHSDGSEERIELNEEPDGSYYYITLHERNYLIWGLKKSAVIEFRLDSKRTVSFDVKKSDEEYLFPIVTDESSNGSEALLFAGNKIIRFENDRVKTIEIDTSSDAIKECVGRSNYKMRDLFGGLLPPALFTENREFGVDEFVNSIID